MAGEESIALKYPTPMLSLAVLLGAFLRFYRLGCQSIWGDEALTLQKYAIGGNLTQFLENAWKNSFHPPLYFLIINYWQRLGDSEFMIRLPSAIFGIASIPLIYLLVKRLFGEKYAGVAAMLLAISPFNVWYSQEARMYSLMLLLALGSMFAFLKVWETRRARDLAVYGIVSLLGLFTHMSFILVILSQGIFTLGAIRHDRRKSLTYIAVQMLLLLVFLPWMLYSISARGDLPSGKVIGFERENSPVHIAYGLYTFAVGYSLGPTVAGLHYSGARSAIENHVIEIVIPMLIFGALLVAGVIESRRVNRIGFQFVNIQFIVPIFLTCAALVFPLIPLNPRYLMTAMPPFLILTALGAAFCLRRACLRWIPVVGVLIIGFSLYNNYFQPERGKQDMRSAVRYVDERARPGDIIIISSVELGGPFIYYNRHEGIPFVGYPHSIGLVQPAKLTGDMNAILHGRDRAWLILGKTWSSDPHGLIRAYFRQRCAPVCGRNFTGVSVSCFQIYDKGK